MRRILSTTAIGLAILTGAANAQSTVYDVEGTEPSGTPYTGTATITMEGEATARVDIELVWGTIHGNCMVHKDDMACHADAGGGQYTIGMYRRQADGSYTGSWVHSGFKGVGRENLTPRD